MKPKKIKVEDYTGKDESEQQNKADSSRLNKISKKISEVMIAALLSVFIHAVSYDLGYNPQKYDNF